MKVRVGSTRSDQDALANNVEKRLDEMDEGIRPWLRGAPRRMIMKHPTNGEGNSTNSVAAVVVNVKKWFLWDWTMPEDTLGDLRRVIGESLRSPRYITQIASRVIGHLQRLGEKHGSGPSFCAAHLRSEADMQHMGAFANGTRLTDTFLKAASESGKRCTVLYVAAGTKDDLARFATLAAPQAIVLVTRDSLANTTTLLNGAVGWTYAQSAVLEYEILAASSTFFGASVSSFSWNLAIRRYFARHRNDKTFRPASESPLSQVIKPQSSTPYHDSLSTLFFGRAGNGTEDTNHERRALHGMWP
jgi:hypothetical protein